MSIYQQRKFTRKRYVLIIVLLIVCISIYSCTSDDTMHENNESSNQVNEVLNNNDYSNIGNKMSNIINMGLATLSEGYFIGTLGDGIYKVNLETFESELVSNDLAYSINSFDDWIYYSNGYPGKGEIYRVSINGDESEKMNDERSYNLIRYRKFIYYWTRNTSGEDVEYSIKKLNLEDNKTSSVISLVTEESATNYSRDFYLHNDWIYYKNPTDNFKLYKISIDGDINEKVMDELFHNEYSNGSFIVDDEYIYFVQPNDNNKLYSLNMGNGDVKLVIDKQIGNFNIDDDYIYYTDLESDFMLFRVSKDGSNPIKLSEKSFGDINLLNDLIYCQSFYKETQYYLLDINGSEINFK